MRTKNFYDVVYSSLPIGVLLLGTFSPACAADGEIIATDRPGYVESSTVMSTGQFQVETSISLEKDRQSALTRRTVSMPTLLRYGISKTVELRLEGDGRTVSHTKDTDTNRRMTDSGVADTAIGLKWHVGDGNGLMPSIGVLLHAEMDTGSKAFRGNGTRPSLRVVSEWELPADFSLGVMPGVTYNQTENGHRYTSPSIGVALTHNETEKLRTFVEVAMPQIARQRNGGIIATFDFGAAYLLTKTCQIDAQFLRGLNHNTPDASLAIGLSFRM